MNPRETCSLLLAHSLHIRFYKNQAFRWHDDDNDDDHHDHDHDDDDDDDDDGFQFRIR